MSEIELGNESASIAQFKSRVILGELERPRVLDMILKTKIVKSEAAAVRVLLLGAGLLLVISIIIFGQTFSDAPKIQPLDMEAIRSNANPR